MSLMGSLLLGLVVNLSSPPMQPETFEGPRQEPGKIQYQLYLPEGYEGSTELVPLVVFLHGAGERGSDLQRTLIHGPGREVKEGRKYPFILVVPQCAENQWWDVRALASLLDDLERRYRVDKDREYLTGLSMGGYGTWEWAGYQPDRFAAIAPVCGGGSRVWVYGLKAMPIFCVHGDSDPVVRIQESEWMLEAAKSAQCSIKFRVVVGGGHDVWTQFYDSDEWWKWMMQFRRPDRAAGRIAPSYERETVPPPLSQ